ncbi:uncharacterized protein JCM15063_004759 [Sporobolomyces koalae]|uniref:uncharacterized protein n=1 Tax=Sporobolomyces koalae TaxID=500713 RepID=UPI003177DAB5
MASEFGSTTAAEVDQDQLALPGPVLNPLPGPIPSFQDLTDSSGDDQDDEQDWEAIIRAAEEAFSEEQISEMTEYLKERGLFAFVNEYVDRKGIPIRTLLLAFGLMIPHELPYPDQLRMLKIACSRVLRNRDRLEQYQTIEDAVDLIRRSKKILFLTGAGVSTSCGIPDFRSPTGLYARLKAEGTWELDDPQDMFDLRFFKERPDVFYSFAKEIYPSNFIPSPCHRFVRLLEKNDKLLRNYTQNIDGLFEQVGVEKMLNCHGSFATASCLECRRRYPGSFIEADVYASRVPLCPPCTAEFESLRLAQEADKARKLRDSPPKKKRKVEAWQDDDDETGDDENDGGNDTGIYGYGNLWKGKAIIKPDIVFFGENLSDEFDRKLLADRDQVDLLIVMGTSLRVSPVAQLPSHLPHSVPQILINRDPVSHHNFDICLLGDGDTIVEYLCEKLQEAHVGTTAQESKEFSSVEKQGNPWELATQVPIQTSKKQEVDESSFDPVPTALASTEKTFEDVVSTTPERVSTSHVWLFPGADRESRWTQMVRQAFDDNEHDRDEDTSSESELPGQEEAITNRDAEGTVEGSIELAADLAPGVVAGEGSDGEEESDEEVSDLVGQP